jgi:hypothetical protein
MPGPVAPINSFEVPAADFTAATRSPGFCAAAAGLAGYGSPTAPYRPARA